MSFLHYNVQFIESNSTALHSLLIVHDTWSLYRNLLNQNKSYEVENNKNEDRKKKNNEQFIDWYTVGSYLTWSITI